MAPKILWRYEALRRCTGIVHKSRWPWRWEEAHRPKLTYHEMSFLIKYRDSERENRPGATAPKGIIDDGE